MVVFLEEKSPIGILILRNLKKINRTQKWLSKKTGYSITYIQKVLNGKVKKPSFDFICKVSCALEISIEEFTNINEGNEHESE